MSRRGVVQPSRRTVRGARIGLFGGIPINDAEAMAEGQKVELERFATAKPTLFPIVQEVVNVSGQTLQCTNQR